jgi:hypothetical protein
MKCKVFDHYTIIDKKSHILKKNTGIYLTIKYYLCIKHFVLMTNTLLVDCFEHSKQTLQKPFLFTF